MKRAGGHRWGQGITDQPAHQPGDAPAGTAPPPGPASSSVRARGRHRDRDVPGAVSGSGSAPQEAQDPEPPSRLPPHPGARGHPGLRAGAEQAAPPAPRRPAAIGPRRRGSGPRAVLPERNGAGHGPCLPSRTERSRAVSRGGAASPSRRVSASRRAPCPPSCLSPRPALAAAKRAPISPSPRAEGAKPMAEPPMAPTPGAAGPHHPQAALALF